MTPNFSYTRPDSLKKASERAAAAGAVIHAGGTDLLGCLRDGVFSADMVVSISALKDLKGVRKNADGSIRIGALTTIAEVARNPVLKAAYPGLCQGASEVASPQLRNQGTIGGNICQKPRCWYYRGEFHCLRKGGERCFAEDGENHYHCIFGGDGCYIVHPSDTAPNLVAAGAQVTISSIDGQRTVAIENFFVLPEEDYTVETVLAPGEIVTEIVLPPPPAGLKTSYRKVRARRSWDFAIAGAALALRFDGPVVKDARVVLSGAAPVPWRSRPVEKAIVGAELTDDAIAKASEAVVDGAEPMSGNGYKIPLFKGVIAEELRAVRGKS